MSDGLCYWITSAVNVWCSSCLLSGEEGSNPPQVDGPGDDDDEQEQEEQEQEMTEDPAEENTQENKEGHFTVLFALLSER